MLMNQINVGSYKWRESSTKSLYTVNIYVLFIVIYEVNIILIKGSLSAGNRILLKFLSNVKYLEKADRSCKENEVGGISQNSSNYCN